MPCLFGKIFSLKISIIYFAASRYYYSERENDRAVMVLGNFAVNGWQMSKSVINLDLNHILVAGKRVFPIFSLRLHKTPETIRKMLINLPCTFL